MERHVRREAKNTRRAGKVRKSVAQLAVLGLVAGGMIMALASSVSAGEQNPACVQDDTVGHVFVCKTGPETAVAGTNITYTISAKTTGFWFANKLTVDDVLPAGETLVDASGNGWDCTGSSSTEVLCTIHHNPFSPTPDPISVTVSLDPSIPDGTTVTNCADITWDLHLEAPWWHQEDHDAGLDSQDVSATTIGPLHNEDCWSTTVTQVSDLAVVKTGPTSATVGDSPTYTVTVTNNGPSTSNEITVTDPVPVTPGVTFLSAVGDGWDCTITGANTEVTCTHDPLGPGASASFVITLNPLPDASASQPLKNCATADQAEPEVQASQVASVDPDETNNTSCTELTENGGLIQVKAVTVQPNFPG